MVQTALPWGREAGELEDTDSWCTPVEQVVPATQYFGGMIGLDPASNRWSEVPARVSWTVADDCLRKTAREWAEHGTIWLNPPYSNPGPFLALLVEAAELGADALALIRHDHTTAWWRETFRRCLAVCLLRDRVRFLAGGSRRVTANFPSTVMLPAGPAADLARFRRAYASIGTVIEVPR